MAGKARKGFGKGRGEGKVRILPVQEAPPEGKSRRSGQASGGEAHGEPMDPMDVEDLLDGMDDNTPLAQRMARCLRQRPEQVKRLFTSWVEHEED